MGDIKSKVDGQKPNSFREQQHTARDKKKWPGALSLFFGFWFSFLLATHTHTQHEGRWLYIAHTIHRQRSCGRDVFRTPAWRFLREAHGRALGSILLYSPLLSLSLSFRDFLFYFFFSSSSSPVGSFVSVVRRRKPPAFSSTKAAAWSCCTLCSIAANQKQNSAEHLFPSSSYLNVVLLSRVHPPFESEK